MSLHIVDKTAQFITASRDAADRALGRMAIDIERLSKQQVPHRAGQLKASGHHERLAVLSYRIIYNKEYALYQHEGHRQDGSHVIKRHSLPGKKTHYLIDPAKIIVGRKTEYLKQEAANVRI